MPESQPGDVSEAISEHEIKEVADSAEIRKQLAELNDSLKVAVQQSESLGQTLARITEQNQGSEAQRADLETLYQESQITLRDMKERQKELVESLDTIERTLQELEKHK